MKIIDYELICNISCLLEKRIFIYGTGIYGNKVAAAFLQMGIEIESFCETYPKERRFLGKKVLSTDMLIKNYDEKNVLVIIASEKYYKEMIEELHITENMKICTHYAFFLSLYINNEEIEIPDGFKNTIKLFNSISLDISVRTFQKWGMKWHCDILSQPSLVWLYQSGKVASSTIYKSNPLKIYPVHSLAYAFNTDEDMRKLCELMLDEIKKSPIRIITGVREPISRDISLFFQGTDINIWPLINYGNCFHYLFGDYSKNYKTDIQEFKNRICIFEKSLSFSFERLCKEIIKNRSDEFSWFDYEINALFGVNIYDYPFEKEKGYTIIEQDNIQILVYKSEKLNQLEQVIGDFIEDSKFSFKNNNLGNEKIYAHVYKGFKENVQLNKQYFDYYYADNPKLKHFYTDSEIEQFKNKWKKKLK